MTGTTRVTTFVTRAEGFIGSVLLLARLVVVSGFSDSLYLGFNLARKLF